MTQDELFGLAEKAGLGFVRHASEKDIEKFEQLAKLIAAHEREACVKICDQIATEDGFEGGYAYRCVIHIRERGKS